MNSIFKLRQVVLAVIVVIAITGCSLGQAAAQPTATAVDVNAVMTSAASTAFVQLTSIAALASATLEPSPTPSQVPPTATTDASAPTNTPDASLVLLTPTEGAAGLPVEATANPTESGTPVIGIATLTPLASSGGSSNLVTCFNAKFVADVTIPDNTVMKPYQKFQKVWRIQNTGTCKWDEGFGLTFWAGDSMNGTSIYFSGRDQPVEAGGTVDLGIDMRAPANAGQYIGHWVMINDQGKTFGGDLTVVIKVVP